MNLTLEVTEEALELRASDRCDKCPAQAFVRVAFSTGELLFCGHHYARNEAAIAASAKRVDDFRDQINQKPSESSA